MVQKKTKYKTVIWPSIKAPWHRFWKNWNPSGKANQPLSLVCKTSTRKRPKTKCFFNAILDFFIVFCFGFFFHSPMIVYNLHNVCCCSCDSCLPCLDIMLPYLVQPICAIFVDIQEAAYTLGVFTPMLPSNASHHPQDRASFNLQPPCSELSIIHNGKDKEEDIAVYEDTVHALLLVVLFAKRGLIQQWWAVKLVMEENGSWMEKTFLHFMCWTLGRNIEMRMAVRLFLEAHS